MARTILTLLLLASAVVPGAAGAQAPGDMTAEVEEANQRLDQWIENTRAFVGDVRIDAADIESFIEHYESFSSLGDEVGQDEEFIDYEEVLAEPRYQAWAAANGLAAEPWLKKSMRIIALTMREQMQAGIAQAEVQMPEQRRMIDQQCAQVGAEMCQQMRTSLEAAMAMFEHSKKRIDDLPEETAGEHELLARYRDEMAALMAADDEDEEEW